MTVYFFITTLLLTFTTGNRKLSNELRLTQEVLSKYEKIGIIGRPVKDTRKEINITIGLDLIQILELDENRQILKTNCWLNYKWNDSFLVWDPAKYNDLDVLRVFSNQIWTPDLKLYNFADERLNEHRDARVIVKSSGEVLWVPTALYKTTCPVDLIFFPFDHHYCHLEFGSWTYDAEKLRLIWKDGNDYVDLTTYMQSNEWAIQTHHNEVNKIHRLFNSRQNPK